MLRHLSLGEMVGGSVLAAKAQKFNLYNDRDAHATSGRTEMPCGRQTVMRYASIM